MGITESSIRLAEEDVNKYIVEYSNYTPEYAKLWASTQMFIRVFNKHDIRSYHVEMLNNAFKEFVNKNQNERNNLYIVTVLTHITTTFNIMITQIYKRPYYLLIKNDIENLIGALNLTNSRYLK